MNNSTRLYVANINFRATQEDLASLFETVGATSQVNLISDRNTGRFRGIAFIEMVNEEDAQKAIETLNGALVLDRPIIVRLANPRAPREDNPRRFNNFNRNSRFRGQRNSQYGGRFNDSYQEEYR